MGWGKNPSSNSRASERARRALKEELPNTVSAINKQRFHFANLSCKCYNCSHREPWAKMQYKYIDLVCYCIGLPSFIFFALSGGLRLFLYVFLGSLLWIPTRIIHTAIINRKLKKSSTYSLPFAAMTWEQINAQKKNFYDRLYRQRNPVNIKEIFPYKLRLHKKWLSGEAGGKQLVLDGEDLSSLELKEVRLQRAILKNCLFYNMDLSKTSFRHCDLSNSEFNRCTLEGTDFTGVDLEQVRFNMTKIDKAVIKNK